jgi:hypothetical protein
MSHLKQGVLTTHPALNGGTLMQVLVYLIVVSVRPIYSVKPSLP